LIIIVSLKIATARASVHQLLQEQMREEMPGQERREGAKKSDEIKCRARM